jgi:2',3'-cyclic-nucleotide 2'-phosphodiesterase (5'-nucleotidase family)
MASSGSKRPLTILHTNDFHNRLTTQSAEKIRRRLAETAEPRLLLDAGDAGGSTNITFRPGGEPILSLMSELGYAAMTVGNRDFHVSRTGFRTKVYRAQFPVLCANVRPSRSAPAGDGGNLDHPLVGSTAADEPELRSHAFWDFGDWRVLVFGVTVPMVTVRMWERKLSSYIFDPPLQTASTLVPALRERYAPDLVIGLTHIGLRLDRELAARVAGIDLIVGGHSHEILPQGESVDRTLIVQCGSHGRFIGAVDVKPAEEDHADCRLTARIEPL